MARWFAVPFMSLAVMVFAGSAVHAAFYGVPVSSDIETWFVPETSYQVVVEQKVFEGTGVDAGTWKYLYEVTNDGSGGGGAVVGLGSAMKEFGFTQNLAGGPIIVHFESGDWSFSANGPDGNLTNAPYWTSPTGLEPSTQSKSFSIISAGPPDTFYWGQAVDTDESRTAVGQTTGPTGENGDEFETATPGGWGGKAKPDGNNPASVLARNFDRLYPDGVRIGSQAANSSGDDIEPWSALFETAGDVETWLPSGGTGAPLGDDFTNPARRALKNTFAGHVLALTFNIDLADDGLLGDPLGPHVLGPAADADFTGLTVNELLAMANRALAADPDPGDASIADMLDLISDINNGHVP